MKDLKGKGRLSEEEEDKLIQRILNEPAVRGALEKLSKE